MKILVIEDDVAIGRVLRRGLEQAHYTVETATDGLTGLDTALRTEFSLIILDLMLPGMDGSRICEELRDRRCRTPILMLTARGTISDKVRGFEMGADDYLPKPFDFAELLARVQALLRRDKMHKRRLIRIADLVIDTNSRQVTRGGAEIPLTPREYELLEALASREGSAVTREVIQERVWFDEDSFSNTVDVYIAILRKKIDAGHDVKLIHTMRGVGYTLRRPIQPD